MACASNIILCLSLSIFPDICGPAGLFFLLAFERPRRWFSDLHGDVCVQGILLDLNQPVGQRADAVLLHGVLGVLDFIEPAGGGLKKWIKINIV